MSLAAKRPGGGFPQAPPSSPRSGPCSSQPLALAPIAVVLIAFGSRCWTIATFGSDLPFWDQWDAEGQDVFRPWFAHHLSWQNLLHPHNEHQIVLTRLADLGLLLLNGQWDARLEAVLGSLIQSVLAGLVVRWTARDFSARAAIGFAAVVGAFFSVPFAYENTLGGFQLQMFLLLFLSLTGLRLLVTSEPLTFRSLGGAAIGLLCLGTMASGFLAAAAAMPILLWTAWWRPAARRRYALLGAGLAVIVAAGLLTRVTVPENADMAAHSVGEFLRSWGRFAAWPRWRDAWIAAIFALPWTILMIVEFGKCRAPSPPTRWLAAIGLWAILQITALAYGRNPFPYPAPRYLDLLLFWQLVNVAAAFALTSFSRRPRPRRWMLLACSLWGVFLAIAFVPVIDKDLRPELTGWRADFRSYEQSIRGYVATGDPARLSGKIPYPPPRVDSLRELLDLPPIRRVLPASVSPPPVRAGWLSRCALGTARAGPWILGLGILILGAAASTPNRRPSPERPGEKPRA